LKRAIQKEVETPLARLLLKGEVRDGVKVMAGLGAGRSEIEFQVGEGVRT